MAKYEHSSYVPAYHPPEDRWDEYIDLATRWFLKVQDEIDTILKLADEKLKGLPIDKEKLLYFSNLIKKRGH